MNNSNKIKKKSNIVTMGFISLIFSVAVVIAALSSVVEAQLSGAAGQMQQQQQQQL